METIQTLPCNTPSLLPPNAQTARDTDTEPVTQPVCQLVNQPEHPQANRAQHGVRAYMRTYLDLRRMLHAYRNYAWRPSCCSWRTVCQPVCLPASHPLTVFLYLQWLVSGYLQRVAVAFQLLLLLLLLTWLLRGYVTLHDYYKT